MTESPEQPIDLQLHDVMKENLDLLQKMKEFAQMIVWIKFFIVFCFVVFVLLLARIYRFF